MITQPQHPTAQRNCERCGRPLPLVGEGEAILLVSDFPEKVYNCFIHLQHGPRALPCLACDHVNQLGLPQAIVGADVQGLLYMPENISRGSPQEERALDAFRRRFRNDPIVVYDARSFRRTFIEMFLQRHLAALNDFRTTDENMLVWITKNETAITPSFFAAGWLASVGAVFVLSRPPEQAPRNLFLPHEETTDAERHVVQQHTVHTEVAVGVGRILAALLVRWAVRCMEAHSFETFRAIAPRLVPKIVMAGTIADQLVERIGEMVAGFEIGTPGATAGRYVFEAVLALLFAANGLDNPRRKNWTDILVRYEFERRLDGNDEALLLDPELLRSSIDQDEFLKEIRGFGAGLGRLDDKSEQIHHHLFDTIERIFPEEVNQLVRPELVLDESLSDAQALEISISLFHKAIAEPHSDTIDAAISALLRGLRRRPPIVEPAIRAMWSAKTDSPGTKHRIEFARRAIETLNLSHHFASALDIATEAEQLLPDAKDLSPFEVSTFLNEVGNCLRYAGAFQAALQRYAAAEAALGDASKQNSVSSCAIAPSSCAACSATQKHVRSSRDCATKHAKLSGLRT
jgi:hypothetical protein